MEDIELLIPFDKISIGSKVKPYFSGYNKDSAFHSSAIHSLVYQNVYNILQNKKSHVDM